MVSVNTRPGTDECHLLSSGLSNISFSVTANGLEDENGSVTIPVFPLLKVWGHLQDVY